MGPPDTRDKIRVDLQKMRAEAKLWADLAADMGGAARTAQGLPLDQPTFSFAGVDTFQAYQEIQQWATEKLVSATRSLENMAVALYMTARNYEAQDERTAADLEKLYP